MDFCLNVCKNPIYTSKAIYFIIFSVLVCFSLPFYVVLLVFQSILFPLSFSQRESSWKVVICNLNCW